MARGIPSINPRDWRPIRRVTAVLYDRWELVDVSESTAKWAACRGGFGVLNDYPDRKGYGLFICPASSPDQFPGISGIRRLPSALGAIYAYTEHEQLPEVDGDELLVEVPKPTLGEVVAGEGETFGFDLREIDDIDHLKEVFPQREDEIEKIVDVMGDGRGGTGGGGGGGGGGGDDDHDDAGGGGSEPRRKRVIAR